MSRTLPLFQIQHLTTSTLLWLFTRHDLNKKCVPIVTLILAATCFRGLWLEGILRVLATGPWLTLALKALITSSIGCVTLHMYTGLAQTIGI